ncbi:MAG: 6-hydroxycyclohex-1-ene-1-carbonyl-CoA dehydrogenase [Planctomycetota bacterium]
MTVIPQKISTYQMTSPWTVNPETKEKVQGKIEKTSIPIPQLQPGEVLVEVKGCGVCHTDLGYFYDGVPTVVKPPLTLGHEISGVVVVGDAKLVGKEVIIPAVMPCNKCPICAAGRNNRCLNQKMPGNSLGNYGGFASHIPVPAEDLCIVENRGEMPLEWLAVIADAVTTPYQAAKRADLKDGDRVIVIGLGGVGSYMAQMAKAFGASTVIGIDISDEKLQRAREFGVDHTINPKGKDAKAVIDEFRTFCKGNGLPHNFGWKIFEVSGTKGGQETALFLLSFVGKLVIVGFGMAKLEYMISKLMAFDAEIIGTWGCLPKYYPEVLKMVLEGKIKIEQFVETRPMSKINEVFEKAHEGKLSKRIVLTPDF